MRPVLRLLHALVERERLLLEHLLAERALVEGDEVLELLLGEVRGVDQRHLVDELGLLALIVLAQLRGDVVELARQVRIVRHQRILRGLDHAGDHRLEHRRAALDHDQLAGRGDRPAVGAGAWACAAAA